MYNNCEVDSYGFTSLLLESTHYTVLRTITSVADISYPISNKTYGWYAVNENWSGAKVVNKSGVTVTVDYIYTSHIIIV